MTDTQPRPAQRSHDRHFQTDHLHADLKGHSIRGGAVTLSAQFLRFALQTGSTVILARLLTPADFGLIAMVAAFTGFVGLFRDLGLSMATVQNARITHGQVSTLFWINVALSILLTAVGAALAPIVAWFYGEPRLLWITIAISALFIFGGLAAQHSALLKRQMRFGWLAGIDIAAMVCGIFVAVALALMGARYWALIGMMAAQAVVGFVGAWIASGWRPGPPRRGSGVLSMLKFGGNLTGSSVFSYFARNTDNVLIGWYWGAGVLGLYSRAYNLLTMPLVQINAPFAAVAIPALSRLQDDPERYRRYYIKAVSMIALITMPGVAYLLVMSEDVIRLVLGPQWIGASRIFMFLGIAALGQPVASTTGWLYVSQGRGRDMLNWSFIGSAITVTAIVVGLRWGSVGVAAAYTIFNVLATPLLFWLVGRRGPVQVSHIWRGVAVPFWMSLFVMAGLLSLKPLCHEMALPIRMISMFVAAISIMLLSLLLLPGGRELLAELMRNSQKILRRGSPRAAHTAKAGIGL